VENLVPLIPAHAYRPVTRDEHTYGCLTLAVHLPTWGKVWTVVSVEHAPVTGRLVMLVTNRVD
jgi:hypothetical protein